MSDKREILHYGIPNMRWGVRRFQYENGSYTPEGKERYGRNGNNEKQGLIRVVSESIAPKLKEKRLEKARKEIEESGLKDRFDDKELDSYSKVENGRFRKAVLLAMKKNPKLKYGDAHRQQTLKAIGIAIAMFSAGILVKDILTKKVPSVVSLFLKNNNQKKLSEVDEDKLDLKTIHNDYGIDDNWNPDKSDPIVWTKHKKQVISAPRIDFDNLK